MNKTAITEKKSTQAKYSTQGCGAVGLKEPLSLYSERCFP